MSSAAAISQFLSLGRCLNEVFWVKEGIKHSNGKTQPETAFEKRLFRQKSEAVRLNIPQATYLCRDGVVKMWSQRVLHLLDHGLPSSLPGRSAAGIFRLCRSRRAPCWYHPRSPQVCNLITAQSATFSAGASFNYHFDLEEEERKKCSILIDKNAKVWGLNQMEIWQEEPLKSCRLRPHASEPALQDLQ